MIELENVVFRYPGSERGVGPVSFSIKDGERVAITGASGCGKSTLLRLIMGLYEPDSGKILLNGTPCDMQERRKLTGYVPQEASIFSASLYENIVWARPEAAQEEVGLAAKRAHIHEFITGLPAGYDTIVNDRSLSGGQKQRIAIARAILKGAGVVLLDEITSSLDPLTSEEILREIPETFDGCTVLMVTHDRKAVKYMDREICLE